MSILALVAGAGAGPGVCGERIPAPEPSSSFSFSSSKNGPQQSRTRTRPVAGKPETRRYKAVFFIGKAEIGLQSDIVEAVARA